MFCRISLFSNKWIAFCHSILTHTLLSVCVCVCAHWKCVQLIESISFNYRSCNVRNFVGKSIFEAQMASLNDTIQLSNFSLCCVLLFWRDINEIQIMRYQSNRIIVAPTTTTTLRQQLQSRWTVLSMETKYMACLSFTKKWTMQKNNNAKTTPRKTTDHTTISNRVNLNRFMSKFRIFAQFDRIFFEIDRIWID